MYKVLIEKAVQKQLDKISEPDYSKVKKAIIDLGINPRPKGYLKLIFLILACITIGCVHKQTRIHYYSNGQKKDEYTLVDKKINGFFYCYDSIRGNLKYKVFAKDGFRNGEYVEYYQNGDVLCVGIFKDNKREGQFKWFYHNKKDSVIGYYIDGKANGHWIEYYPNGQRKVTCFFKNDKQDSIYTTYWENGKIREVEWYTNNHFMGWIISYKESGDSIIGNCSKTGQYFGNFIDTAIGRIYSYKEMQKINNAKTEAESDYLKRHSGIKIRNKVKVSPPKEN